MQSINIVSKLQMQCKIVLKYSVKILNGNNGCSLTIIFKNH